MAANEKKSEGALTTTGLKTLKLSVLKPHPEQAHYFREYSPFEYEQLKADIAANGVRVPPEVLPPGNAAGLHPWTLVKGHARCKIWGGLGHASIAVRVRHDLREVERAVIDEEFLRDNVARRQLDKLGQARAAVGLYLIERTRKGRRVSGDPLACGELRDRVGRIVGMSGRNLKRYMNVLAAPLEVQDAFQAGAVRLVDAARFVGLGKREREALVARLRKGDDAKAVFAEFLPRGGGRPVKAGDSMAAFVKAIERAAALLDGRVHSASAGHVRKHEKSLRKGRKLIRTLLAKLDPDG